MALAAAGASATAVARATGIPRGTINDWLSGKTPTGRRGAEPAIDLSRRQSARQYVYLLGLYLGDGYVASHGREVYRLRLSLDQRYPAIISEAIAAVGSLVPGNRVLCQRYPSWVEVSAYSKHWPGLLPQHGPGKKHERAIVLCDWQDVLVEGQPDMLLRGLIHSDGCRFMNTCRGGWSTPRYAFSNRSLDIHGIFRDACDLVGVRWTTCPHTTYVSRKADVALLDEFIGPKT